MRAPVPKVTSVTVVHGPGNNIRDGQITRTPRILSFFEVVCTRISKSSAPRQTVWRNHQPGRHRHDREAALHTTGSRAGRCLPPKNESSAVFLRLQRFGPAPEDWSRGLARKICRSRFGPLRACRCLVRVRGVVTVSRVRGGNPRSPGRGGNAFSSAECLRLVPAICGPQRYRLVQQSPRHVSQAGTAVDG